VPMNLWYAGLLIALVLQLRGNEQARKFGSRLLKQMPVIIAIGVNLGVVPLLFLQLAYHKFFYPATILMAWFWLGIIVLLTFAYYGVYAYAWRLRSSPDRVGVWPTIAGWCAAIFFLAIGFTFANGLSLTEHVDRWIKIWEGQSRAGAVWGTGLNVGDPALWPRWLMMFGFALGTTAVWALVDAFLLTGKAGDENYRRWAWGFAKKLYTVSMIWAAVAGAWYVFGTWPGEVRSEMFHWPLVALTIPTAMATGLPWLLIALGDRFTAKGAMVALIALSQFGVLGINAVSRQVVQNLNLSLSTKIEILKQPTDIQWGPLWMFLIVFVIGLAVVAWMLQQVRKCKAE
jgi:hypothetical protein